MAADFDGPTLNASPCNFQIGLPRFSFGFQLPSISFPPPIPFPKFAFELSCSLDQPVNVSAGLEYGGGRQPAFDPDPDNED